MTPWRALASKVFKKELKSADLLHKSQSLKTVISPWKILEKSLKFGINLGFWETAHLPLP